jgi:uncharacterized membrane protein
MAQAGMTREAARFELTLLCAEQSAVSFDDVLVAGARHRIPAEFVTRLKSVWEFSRHLGGEVIEIGKIVVNQILKFLDAHPGMVWGLVVGTALAVLVSSVPILGPVLAPLMVALGVSAGLAIDANVSPTDPRAVILASGKAFFELFINVIRALADHASS